VGERADEGILGVKDQRAAAPLWPRDLGHSRHWSDIFFDNNFSSRDEDE